MVVEEEDGDGGFSRDNKDQAILHEAIAVNPFLRTIMQRKPLWEKVAENLVVM